MAIGLKSASGSLKDPRALAARVLVEVALGGRSLTAALEALPASTAQRNLVQELVYGGLRYWHTLDALASALQTKPFRGRDEDLRALLLLGLYQLRALDMPPALAVTATVEASVALGKAWAKGALNAMLRRYLRERDALEARIATDVAAQFSHPPWLLDTLQHDWPRHWRAIAQANTARPPMTLRVNLRYTSRAAYLTRLGEEGIAAHAVADNATAIVLDQPVGVQALPDFARGAVSVQDGAAQWSAPLLDLAPGQRVLDACAAPGGKTGHILEAADVELLALDVDPARVARIEQNLARLNLRAQVQCADATAPATWWDGRAFDRVLLDAPCSATGVIRRHPDIKLHRRPRDIDALVETQARLLAALWPLLAVGGKLLYVACSVLARETHLQIERFVGLHADARTLALDIAHGERMPFGTQILPGAGEMDGFYYACLHKTA